MTPQQIAKLERLAKALDNPVAIIHYIEELESRIEELSSNVDTKLEKTVEEVKNSVPNLLNILEQIKGKDGNTPTIEELTALIHPLIPEPIKGDDYMLTDQDKKDIAREIKVPVVEKVIEVQKTEIIKEIPIVTENVVEKAVADSGEVIVEKINDLPTDPETQIDAKHIKNLPKLVQSWGGGGFALKGLTAGTGITIDNSNLQYPTISSSAGHTIKDEGTPLTQRANLNFIGAGVTVTDDSGNDATKVTISNSVGLVEKIGFTVDGGGSAITTGKVKGFMVVPFAGTITAWNIVLDAGTATIKTWRIATGTAKPTSANSISTSGVAISSGTAVRSTTVTDFTSTTVTAGDIFAWNIEAIATATEISFILEITRT